MEFPTPFWLRPELRSIAARAIARFGLVEHDPRGALPLASGGTTDLKLELRRMGANPRSVLVLRDYYSHALRHLSYDVLVDVPHGVSMLTAHLSTHFLKPTATLRSSVRPGQKELIIDVAPGSRCVVIDDVMASGVTKAARLKRLAQLGVEVVAVVVFIDRNEGWRELFQAEGINVPVWSAMPFEELRHHLANL